MEVVAEKKIAHCGKLWKRSCTSPDRGDVLFAASLHADFADEADYGDLVLRYLLNLQDLREPKSRIRNIL